MNRNFIFRRLENDEVISISGGKVFTALGGNAGFIGLDYFQGHCEMRPRLGNLAVV
jgi:hypothetical protein